MLIIKELRKQCCIYNFPNIVYAHSQDIQNVWYHSSFGIVSTKQNVASVMDSLQNYCPKIIIHWTLSRSKLSIGTMIVNLDEILMRKIMSVARKGSQCSFLQALMYHIYGVYHCIDFKQQLVVYNDTILLTIIYNHIYLISMTPNQ